MLCYCAEVVVQGLLPLPGQTPLGFDRNKIVGMISCHRHVGDYLGALISKTIWKHQYQATYSRKLCFVSGHGEDCLNNR